MREYGRVAPTFWTRGTGKSLRGDRDAQIVALYLMSAPTSNMIGLYYIPVEIIALETGIPIEGASKALRRAIEGGFAIYDEDTETVFVITMARRQLGLEEGERLSAEDKRCTGIVRLMRECGSAQLLRAFWDTYRDTFHLPEPWWKEAPPKPLRSPSEAPPKPGSGSGSGASSSAGSGARSFVELGTQHAESPKSKSKPEVASKAEPTSVEIVFAYWASTFAPKAKLDDKRRKVLTAALAMGYSVEDLCRVVDGTLHNPHRMGDNDRGKRFVDISLLYRDADHIDDAIATAEKALEVIEPDRDDFDDGRPDPDDPDPPGEPLEITPELIQGLLDVVNGVSNG